MPRSRELARASLSVAVTAGLLGALVWRLDREALARSLQGARWGWLAVAALLGPAQVALSAERWRVVSGALGAPLPRGVALREVALSVLLNQLLPGGLAGDALRAWRGRREWPGLGGAVRAVLADRWVGLAVHTALVVAGLLAWPALHGVAAPPGALPGALVLALALAALPLVPAGFPGLGALAVDLRRTGARAPAVAGLSAALSAAILLAFAATGVALGRPLGAATVTAVPLVLLATAVPLSVGGWGLREAGAALVLPRLGWTPEEAVALSAAYGLTALAGALPGALVPLARAR
jgi:uncharacterized membrane protein YbhN (UPF0104 family)